ncbi:MAG: hypothetical protein WCI89_02545 [bacterium]
MQNQRGFVGVGILIAIVLGLIVLGGGAYYVIHQQSSSSALSDNTLDNSQTLPTKNNQAQTTANTPTSKPSVTLTLPKSGTQVPYGGNLQISWHTANVPTNAKVLFYLNEPADFKDVGPIDPVGSANAADGSYTWHVDLTDCTGSGCSTIESGKSYTLTIKVGTPQDTTNCNTHCGNWFDSIAEATSNSFIITNGASASANWQTYRSTNGFEIQYPPNWIEQEHGDGHSSFGFVAAFGQKPFGPDGYDGELFVVGNDFTSTEQFIAQMGKQFGDRQEKRESISVNGLSALKVTVTTPSIPSWIFKAVIIKRLDRPDEIYFIHNGAIQSNDFEKFYGSFKLI